MVFLRTTVSALVLMTTLLAGCAMFSPAAPKDGELALPADYKSWPKFLSAVQRPDVKQIREIYMNPAARQATAAGGFPNGTVFVMENFAARARADGTLETGPDGKLIVRAIRIGGAVQLSVHQFGNGVELVAARPMPGSEDICFRFTGKIEQAAELLQMHGVEIIDGPSPRENNQMQPSQSVYFRDPDGNLVELMATD